MNLAPTPLEQLDSSMNIHFERAVTQQVFVQEAIFEVIPETQQGIRSTHLLKQNELLSSVISLRFVSHSHLTSISSIAL